MTHHRLEAGDTLLFYTDGLVELTSSAPGTDARGAVARRLRTWHGTEPDTIVADIEQALEAAAGEIRDDVAVLVARIPADGGADQD